MTTGGNGGSAFPTTELRDGNGNGVIEAGYGMTLRDYFAAQAIVSIPIRKWDHLGEGQQLFTLWAQAAYAMADAMLAERSKS